MRIILCISAVTIIIIAACNNPTTQSASATISNGDTSARRGCFLHALNKDSTFLELTLQNGKAAGKFYWLPDQKDRANGVLEGTYTGDTVRVNYTYMIEGSMQEEEKVFVWGKDSVSVLFALLDVNGTKMTLQKDKPLQVAIRMSKVDCASFQIPEFKH
jgi:hypothetical protein